MFLTVSCSAESWAFEYSHAEMRSIVRLTCCRASATQVFTSVRTSSHVVCDLAHRLGWCEQAWCFCSSSRRTLKTSALCIAPSRLLCTSTILFRSFSQQSQTECILALVRCCRRRPMDLCLLAALNYNMTSRRCVWLSIGPLGLFCISFSHCVMFICFAGVSTWCCSIFVRSKLVTMRWRGLPSASAICTPRRPQRTCFSAKRAKVRICVESF